MRPLHSRRSRTKLTDAHEYRKAGHFTGMSNDDYLSDEDRIRIVQEVETQLLETTKQHFPRTHNLEYAILKAHLIMENALTEYIRCTSFVLVEPEALRFSFAEKLEIAILHGFGNGCPTTVPSVELLNKVRNQVAHRLMFDQNLVDQLIQINSGEVDVKKLTDRQRVAFLRRWCDYVCGRMAGGLRTHIEMTTRAEPATGASRGR